MKQNKQLSTAQPVSPFGLISRYRGELMGFATLWVVFFHSPIRIPEWLPSFLREPLDIFRVLGYGGVDLFILVSGIGIYQSLSKNSPSTYIKNRFKRIYPIWAVYIVMVTILAAVVLHNPYTFREFIGNISLFGHWSPALKHQGNWYVFTIILFYIIAPIPFFLLRDSKRKTLTCAVLVTIALVGSTVFFSTNAFVTKHLLIAFSRLPLFIIGLYFSAALKERVMKAADWIICVIVFLIGVALMVYILKHQQRLLWTYGLWWYPFILIAPTMALLLSKLFCICERPFRHWHAVLRFLGKASLEIFLISNYIFKRTEGHIKLNGWQSILFSIGAILAGIVFYFLIKWGTKGVTAVYHKLKPAKE